MFSISMMPLRVFWGKGSSFKGKIVILSYQDFNMIDYVRHIVNENPYHYEKVKAAKVRTVESMNRIHSSLMRVKLSIEVFRLKLETSSFCTCERETRGLVWKSVSKVNNLCLVSK